MIDGCHTFHNPVAIIGLGQVGEHDVDVGFQI